MEMQIIKKTIEIKASKEKVWDVLLQDQFNRIWYAEFSEGTYAETDWQVGSKAVFIDQSGSGLLSKVVINQPHEVLSLEHQGMISNGTEDYESVDAQAMKGTHETYRLTEKDGVTQLAIELDMGAEYYDFMAAAWEKALQKIKELAENTGGNSGKNQ